MNASASKPKKFFTVAEANKRLPLVRVIVDDIVRLFTGVHDRRQRLERIRQSKPSHREGDVYSEELDQIEEELEKDESRLRGFISELEDLGVEMKDPLVGLIDFPTKIDGREACLCWKLGEEEIGFWHELQAGFQGRQSLLEGSVSVDRPESGAHD
jgi:hypothetical protein